MSRLEHYMAFMKLPPELQLRINNYYQARYGGKWFNEKHVMDTVSSALKEVVQQHIIHSLSRDCRYLPRAFVQLGFNAHSRVLKRLFDDTWIIAVKWQK